MGTQAQEGSEPIRQVRPTVHVATPLVRYELTDLPMIKKGNFLAGTDPLKFYYVDKRDGLLAHDVDPIPFITTPLMAEVDQDTLVEAEAYEVTLDGLKFYRMKFNT